MPRSCEACVDCFLIDVCCIYEKTPLSQAVGENSIKVSISAAQEHKIASYSLLGSECFEWLCSAVKSGEYTGIQGEVLDRLESTLIWWTYYYWLTLFGSGVNLEDGRQNNQGGNLQAIDTAQLNAEIKRIEALACSAEERFRAWIECQDLPCSTCEPTCSKCSTCDSCKCNSKCSCSKRCTCNTSLNYPGIQAGLPVKDSDEWFAV